MTEYGWVSLISLAGCLALVLGSYGARRISAGKTLVMAAAWIVIFLLVAGIFVAVGG